MSILSGMRVVEGSAFVAVPLAGMQLAQMGAEVIRFDRLGGGLDYGRLPVLPNGQSMFWAGLNKGKKSIAVNMKTDEGRELITRIITAPGPDAGLFITNLRVRGWMDHETLSQHRDDLISVTLTGDRHGGPAVDYTVNPALGIPDITGPEGYQDPVANALPAWDCMAGNMVVSSLLAAERHRLRYGQGQAVEFALKDVAAATIGHLGMIAEATLIDQPRQKAGNALFGAYGQDFVCACGGRVMVIGLTDRQWNGLVKATQSEAAIIDLEASLGVSLQAEEHRWTHRAKITAILTPWFATHRIDEFQDKFNKMSLTWSRFNSVKQAIATDTDQFADNPMFHHMMQPGIGSYLVPAHPVSFDQAPTLAPRIAPALGQHTEEILHQTLQMTTGEMGKLFDRGIVASPTFNRDRFAA